MNFLVDRSPILNALQKVQLVVEKKNTIPILGNILCTLQNRELSLCATDLEVGIKVKIPVDSDEHGSITLAAKHFLDIVKELPEKKLHFIRKDNHWIEILCGKSRFNIVSLPAEQFPVLPHFEDKNYFEGRVDVLSDMIDRTQFATSPDTTRFQINGVFLECAENNTMRMVATDGHRLSFIDQQVFEKNPDLKRGIILPKKGLNELRKILNEASSTVGLSFERGYLFVRFENTFLFLKLIDGEYPDYRPLIPKNIDQTVIIDRQIFHSALKRVGLLSNEKNRGVKLSLQENLLTISSSNSEMGEAREELDVEYHGEPLEIGFNWKYLLENLNVLKTEKFEFLLKNPLSPGVIREIGSCNHTYVIMPMRI